MHPSSGPVRQPVVYGGRWSERGAPALRSQPLGDRAGLVPAGYVGCLFKASTKEVSWQHPKIG
jgi:hypothetical protein